MIAGIDFGEMRYVGYIFQAEYDFWLAAQRGLVRRNPSLDSESREDKQYWQSETYRIMQEDVYGEPGGSLSLH